MDISIEPRLKGLVDELVKTGRYGTSSDVVNDGLRLIEEREAKLHALRDTLDASIARGGWRTTEQVADRLQETANRWRRERGD